jgi:uncharacterized protein YndB with AHSA1/START domain
MTATATKLPTEAEVTLTRTFDAPRDLVFRMWTDPKHLAQWWGPKGFTNPVCEVDAWPGGKMRIDMTAPDGTVYPMTGEFREIMAPERLVFITTAIDHAGNKLLEGTSTVTFTEHGGKTTITLRSHAVALSPIAPQMLAGMKDGWTQSIDKLGELVARVAK